MVAYQDIQVRLIRACEEVKKAMFLGTGTMSAPLFAAYTLLSFLTY